VVVVLAQAVQELLVLECQRRVSQVVQVREMMHHFSQAAAEVVQVLLAAHLQAVAHLAVMVESVFKVL
jgi:hypothetical protein